MSNQRSNSLTQSEPQSITLWFDEEKNKHYLVNNETGAMKEVLKTGDFIRRFDVRCTGSKSFKERLEFAQNKVEYAPHIPTSLKFDPKKAFYAPVPDKYDGYMQFRCPRGTPWANQTMVQDKKVNPETIKRWIGYAKTSLEPQSPRNSTIWTQDRGFNPHLTAPLNKFEMLKSQSSDNFKHELKKRNWLPPNTTMLEKSMLKIKEKEAEEKKRKELIETMKEQSIPVNITVTRYKSKVGNTENKTISFPDHFRDTQNMLRTYIETKENESLNLTDLARNVDKYKTQTFNKHISFRRSPFDVGTETMLKTEKDYMKRLTREKQEMVGYVIPPEKDKNSVLTKGRFGTVIDTEGARYIEDRKLMQAVNPELYVVKENKSAQMRRAALNFQKGTTNQQKGEESKTQKAT